MDQVKDASEFSSTLDASQPSSQPQNPNINSDQPPPPESFAREQPPSVVPAEAIASGSGAPTNAALPPSTETPMRRGPGRPKGSGKKTSLDKDAPPKVKRPVGRPRKDGLPAGSLLPPREKKAPGRPRKSAPGSLGGHQFQNGQLQQTMGANVFPYSAAPIQGYPAASGSGQQQWQTIYSTLADVMQPRSSVPVMGSLQSTEMSGNSIDPKLEENWAALARSRPDTFMRVLLASLSAPNPVSTVGPSIEDAFRSHLVSLTPKDVSREHTEIPSLYSILKTFWLPTSPAYFTLTGSASTGRKPSEHRFLYWDPQPLVFNGLPCPNCSIPLINKGRIRSGPVKVYDLGKPFFIIGCEYQCRSQTCTNNGTADGCSFASTDLRILQSLPVALQDEFPAHLLHGSPESSPDLGPGPNVWNWQALGVSVALYNMVRGCLRVGMSRDVILAVIRGIRDGIPDDPPITQAEEEEEDAEHEEEEKEAKEASQKETVVPNPPVQNDSAGAYFSAWRAITAAADTNNAAANGQSVFDSNAVPAKPRSPAAGAAAASTSAQPQQPYPYTTYPYTYAYGTYYQTAAQQQQPQQPAALAPGAGADPNALKRPYPQAEGSPTGGAANGEPQQKRIRHCCKCGSQECKGKGGRAFCTNACQDCGKLECQGRNSKRPDKTCRDAWP